jgi:hypothetical protein
MWCDNPYRRAGRRGDLPYNGRYRRSRGQTLVLVVLIMLVVALLAALLVAVILANQAHTGRAGDVAALNNTVEAGLRYADYQLTYSADGADWRPTPTTEANPFPYTFGRGQFKLTLSYNPQNSGELANFIKIECTARLLDAENKPIPFLRRTQIAYKPILLADYLRFISNKDHSSLPAILGVPSVFQGTGEVAYTTDFYGPIRANTDIQWTRNNTLGSALTVFLTDTGTDGYGFARRDRIQTSGSFLLDDGATVRRWDSSAGDWSAAVNALASSDSGFDVTLGLGSGIARYVDGVRNIRYQTPPAIDTTDPTTGQSRYLLLTRDSGTWQPLSGSWHNTGEYGYGQGIYVNNSGDIQFGHDLNKLRNQWMNPAPSAAWWSGWDESGWSYTPNARYDANGDGTMDAGDSNWPIMQITLWPTAEGNNPNTGVAYPAGVPTIELTRSDGGYWLQSDGVTPVNVDGVLGNDPSIYLPYPKNGVLYTEGSVRVSGVLPPAINPGERYYIDDSHRYYDLSIVSGGTIYIEGDIMSPNTYVVTNGGLISGYSSTDADELHNTRVALLAKDNVCLNMTAFGARYTSKSASGATWNSTYGYWDLAPGGSSRVTWSFRSFQPTVAPLLYIRHSGLLGTSGAAWDDGGMPPIPYPSLLKLNVNGGTDFDWGGDTTFHYHPNLLPSELYQTSRHWNEIGGSAPPPPDPDQQWEVSVRDISSTGITSGATNSIVATNSGVVGANNDVAIAGFQVLPKKINIDALIFAQEGSWFMLPGPWFNSDWAYTGNQLTDPVDEDAAGWTGLPSYRRALGSIPLVSGYDTNRPRINFSGAITESHTAALGDAHDWLSKWSGPGANPLVSYTFDGGLRATPYKDVHGNALLRIPKLPCPPGLILWEKQQ